MGCSTSGDRGGGQFNPDSFHRPRRDDDTVADIETLVEHCTFWAGRAAIIAQERWIEDYLDVIVSARDKWERGDGPTGCRSVLPG